MCRLLEKPVYGGGKQLRNDQLALSLLSCAANDQQQQQQQSGAATMSAVTPAAGSVQQPQQQQVRAFVAVQQSAGCDEASADSSNVCNDIAAAHTTASV
jgi:hypothetical protein